jgi:F-type H+-transporting ATPase subunit delta
VNVPSYLLAKLYARAYLATVADVITIDDFHALELFKKFLGDNKELFSLLAIPIVAANKKIELVRSLSLACGVKIDLGPLVALLIEDRRTKLLQEVIKYSAILYKRDNNIQSFTIASSHALSDAACAVIKNFLERETGSSVVYTRDVDPSLIAGIRLHSDTLVWEYSIDKQLRELRLMLVQ